MATGLTDADEIRRQMGLIRRELHKDVRGVVATAEAVTDWRRYLTAYPLVSVGVAVLVGYLVVPNRKVAEAPQRTARKSRSFVQRVQDAPVQMLQDASPSRKKSLISAGIGLLTPVLLRAAQGYAIKYLEAWIQQQQINAGSGRRDLGLGAGVVPRATRRVPS